MEPPGGYRTPAGSGGTSIADDVSTRSTSAQGRQFCSSGRLPLPHPARRVAGDDLRRPRPSVETVHGAELSRRSRDAQGAPVPEPHPVGHRQHDGAGRRPTGAIRRACCRSRAATRARPTATCWRPHARSRGRASTRTCSHASRPSKGHALPGRRPAPELPPRPVLPLADGVNAFVPASTGKDDPREDRCGPIRKTLEADGYKVHELPTGTRPGATPGEDSSYTKLADGRGARTAGRRSSCRPRPGPGEAHARTTRAPMETIRRRCPDSTSSRSAARPPSRPAARADRTASHNPLPWTIEGPRPRHGARQGAGRQPGLVPAEAGKALLDHLLGTGMRPAGPGAPREPANVQVAGRPQISLTGR
jgi:hypothetical protein